MELWLDLQEIERFAKKGRASEAVAKWRCLEKENWKIGSGVEGMGGSIE